MGMLLAQSALEDRQRPLVRRPGPGQGTLVPQHEAQVVDQDRHGRVVGAVDPLVDRQRPLGECWPLSQVNYSLFEPTLARVESRVYTAPVDGGLSGTGWSALNVLSCPFYGGTPNRKPYAGSLPRICL